jgi:restriction endonuclease
MAHITTHMAFLKSPLFGSNPVIARTYMYPIATHLRDHLLNYYLVESHNAVDMAQKEKLIKEDANEQAKVIIQVQQFIEQQLGQFGQELAQIDQAAQQFKPQPQTPPDNSMQIAQLNAQIQGQALQQRAQADQARLQIEQAKMQQDAALKQAEMSGREKQAQLDMSREQMRQQGDDQRTQADLAVRERMNTADNQTAMDLAALEIATGEKFSVSTGTGVNPGARR